MNAITYFKLKSPYEGDITKNCALTGSEVDNNFYTLEGRDIKSVELINDKIVVNLMNGEKLTTNAITEDCVKQLAINFDEVNGILMITQNGITQTISGFATNYNVGDAISVDGSLIGNGLAEKPVGISPVAKTGQYRPVKSIIKVIDGDRLPMMPHVFPGDRFLTVENVNDYGYLYNYDGLKKIACKLQESCSEWRIPTKQDWDDMLDAIEPCEEFRNHTDARSNKFLGKYAGKLLKSKEYWKKDNCHTCNSNGENNENTCIDYTDNSCSEECVCGRHTTCHPDYCGEWGHCHHRIYRDNKGLDKYGFRVVPAGYANEAKDYLYFKERAYFWTATNHEYRDAYIKAFAYNKSNVLQDIFASDNYLSVRLVKNFNGDNYNEREDILGGTYSTVLMPSLAHGKAIWTSVNISVSDCGCDCHCNYILPNDGQGMEYSKKYFINEWTGKEWLRKELLDGESVVVINEVVSQQETSNQDSCHCYCDNDTVYNKNYTEYRVVNGELVDIARLIYDNVITGIDERFEQIGNDIEDLSDRLEAEITNRTNKNEEHEAALGLLGEKVDAAEANIQALNDGLAAEEAARISKDAELEQAIADEVATRETKDAELEAKDTELEQAIADEAAAREAKDTELEAKDVELEAKDVELEAAIVAETEARIAKDEEIEGTSLTQEGTEFDANSGVLTLKSKDGTNDIEVQFNFNFGTF